MTAGKIAVIAAMELEVKPLLSTFRRISDSHYESRTWGHRVSVWISGVGPAKAGKAAREALAENPGMIVSAGYAGGLSSRLSSAELFVADSVRNLGGKVIPCFSAGGFFKCARGGLLSVDRIIGTSEEKKKLAVFAEAVDMESFAIAEPAQERGIPFVSIRVISDTVEESMPLDFSTALAGDHPVRASLGFLVRHPGKIPAVIKLGMRSKKLSGRLSRFCLAFLGNAVHHA